MMHFFQTIFDWYMANLNYFTVFLLMFIESTFLPLPSEIVIPFAAYKAAQNALSVGGVLVAGTTGALTGSLFNYFLALWLGRPLLYRLADTRWAHWLFITKEGLGKTEKYFVDHGRSSTFIGRLVPGIRHLISIPAGLAKMPLGPFVMFTLLGAGLWNIILAIIGYFAYDIRDKIFPYIDDVMYVVGAIFIIWLSWKGYQSWKKNRKPISQ
jgi:membrane protein DedA with SNARE-associated domain